MFFENIVVFWMKITVVFVLLMCCGPISIYFINYLKH